MNVLREPSTTATDEATGEDVDHITCCDDENVMQCGVDGSDLNWVDDPADGGRECTACRDAFATADLRMSDSDECPCPVSALRSLK